MRECTSPCAAHSATQILPHTRSIPTYAAPSDPRITACTNAYRHARAHADMHMTAQGTCIAVNTDRVHAHAAHDGRGGAFGYAYHEGRGGVFGYAYQRMRECAPIACTNTFPMTGAVGTNAKVPDPARATCAIRICIWPHTRMHSVMRAPPAPFGYAHAHIHECISSCARTQGRKRNKTTFFGGLIGTDDKHGTSCRDCTSIKHR